MCIALKIDSVEVVEFAGEQNIGCLYVTLQQYFPDFVATDDNVTQ